MSKSRYIRYSRHITPTQKRRISMPSADTKGVDKDSDEGGKWIRCWKCGFPVNIDTVVIGVDDMAEESVVVQDFDYTELNGTMRGSSPYPGNTVNRPALAEGDYRTASLDTLSMPGPIIQLGIDGAADAFTYTPRQTVKTAGCPFCGCTNL